MIIFIYISFIFLFIDARTIKILPKNAKGILPKAAHTQRTTKSFASLHSQERLCKRGILSACFMGASDSVLKSEKEFVQWERQVDAFLSGEADVMNLEASYLAIKDKMTKPKDLQHLETAYTLLRKFHDTEQRPFKTATTQLTEKIDHALKQMRIKTNFLENYYQELYSFLKSPKNGNIRYDYQDIQIRVNQKPFILEQKLGEGSFGIAFLAKDRDAKNVVVKLLKPKGEELFKNEVIGLKRTGNLLEADEESMMIVQTYFPGITLESLIQKIDLNSPGKDAFLENLKMSYLNLAKEVSDLGLVHNDIAPRNVIVGNNGQMHLIDFGLSRIVKKSQKFEALMMDKYRSEIEFNLLIDLKNSPSDKRVNLIKEAQMRIMDEKAFQQYLIKEINKN